MQGAISSWDRELSNSQLTKVVDLPSDLSLNSVCHSKYQLLPMTQKHHGSSGAIFCSAPEPRRCSVASVSISNEQYEQDMFNYRHLSSASERQFFSSLRPLGPFTVPFTCAPEFGSTCYPHGELTPQKAGLQNVYHPHSEHFQSSTNLPFRPRQSLEIGPFTATMEPQMMHTHNNYPPCLQGHNPPMTYAMAPSPDLMSTVATSHLPPDLLGFRTSSNDYHPTPMWQQNLPLFGPLDFEPSTPTEDGYGDVEGEASGTYDKPYAQLIYEALMQAPGHRMLLRDIYEWFQRNTRKPRDSGTNGWQNSIRHNLSMNQAFENDKNDPATSRGARKANSMWVLTDYATKHGVQSTTRYRKTGSMKKPPANRIPALQRQRSGAKGGQASKRAAARLKRQERQPQPLPYQYRSLESPVPYSHSESPLSTTRGQWSNYSESPITPTDDHFPTATYGLTPHRSYYDYDFYLDQKDKIGTAVEEDENIYRMLHDAHHGYSSETTHP